jgi:serine/threonine protein kinase
LIFKWDEDWYFFMEKIEWQSLHSKTLINRFDLKLSLDEKQLIANMTDKWVREFIKKRFKYDDSYLDMLLDDYSSEYLQELLWNTYEIRKKTWKVWWTPLDNALNYLEKAWFYHKDLHPWNIMLDKNWNIYIIDFWRIKILLKN